MRRLLESLLLGHLPDVLLELPASSRNWSRSPGSANCASSSRSMMPICPVSAACCSCSSSRSMASSSSLTCQGLGNGQRRAAGERVFGGQFVDLVLVAQPRHKLDQLPRERTLFVAHAIPEPLQLVDLFVREGLVEAVLELGRRPDLGSPVRDSGRPASALDAVGLVRREDLLLALRGASRAARRGSDRVRRSGSDRCARRGPALPASARVGGHSTADAAWRRTPDRAAAGCGLGRFRGSYFWYV